ncbi:hypothetical protein Bca4012_050357 [Brassica carinata]
MVLLKGKPERRPRKDKPLLMHLREFWCLPSVVGEDEGVPRVGEKKGVPPVITLAVDFTGEKTTEKTQSPSCSP